MDNLTLQDFMRTRKALIKEQISALRKEYKEIQAAEKAVLDDSDSVGGGSKTPSEKSLTIKEMIVSCLSDNPNGADATAIIELIKAKHRKEIQRSSLTPQLSRLKEANKIISRNGIWSLAPRADAQPFAPQKTEAPHGASDCGEVLQTSPNTNVQYKGHNPEGGVNGT